PQPVQIGAVSVIEAVEQRDPATTLEDVRLDEEQPAGLDDCPSALDRRGRLKIRGEVQQPPCCSCRRARRRACDPGWLEERGGPPPLPGGSGPLRDLGH